MFRLTLTIHPDAEDDVVTQLASTNLTGISQYNRDDGLVDLQAWYATREDALTAYAAQRNPGGEDQIEEIDDQNWNAVHQATWQPLEVGRRWYLVPPGSDVPAPPGRFRLQLKAGLAFGNGDHPTTHLCLAAMEDLVQPGQLFLDVGCGSGLLGEAAELLGGTALGCDLAPVDLPRNAFRGSLDALKPDSVDVAVMNIQAGILADLWPRLAQIAKRHAILSGFLPDQAGGIYALVQPPWRIERLVEQDGWCALIATRSADPDPPPSPLS